jgi:hypothetical protein
MGIVEWTVPLGSGKNDTMRNDEMKGEWGTGDEAL